MTSLFSAFVFQLSKRSNHPHRIFYVHYYLLLLYPTLLLLKAHHLYVGNPSRSMWPFSRMFPTQKLFAGLRTSVTQLRNQIVYTDTKAFLTDRSHTLLVFLHIYIISSFFFTLPGRTSFIGTSSRDQRFLTT